MPRKTPAASQSRAYTPFIYIGTALILSLALFRGCSDSERQQPNFTGKPHTGQTSRVAKPDNRQANTQVKQIDNSDKYTQDAYLQPKSFNYKAGQYLDVGQKTTLQWDRKTLSLTHVKRNNLGEHSYLLDIVTPGYSMSKTFTTYDTISSFNLADLNANSKVEIYLTWVSDGSGSYGIIEGYEIVNKYFAPMQFPENSQGGGYRGHDFYSVYPDSIEHNYPIYTEPDSSLRNTGGTARIRYSFPQNSRKAQITRIE